MYSGLRPQQLGHLYESLSPGERDELLRILLYAATISGETVIQRLEERVEAFDEHEPDSAARPLTGAAIPLVPEGFLAAQIPFEPPPLLQRADQI